MTNIVKENRGGWSIIVTEPDGSQRVVEVLMNKTEKEAQQVLREWRKTYAPINHDTVKMVIEVKRI